MITGKITLEDLTIEFTVHDDQLMTTVTVTEEDGRTDTYVHDSREFMAALAIAVHFDGMPDYIKDYPAAERAMRNIRWIP